MFYNVTVRLKPAAGLPHVSLALKSCWAIVSLCPLSCCPFISMCDLVCLCTVRVCVLRLLKEGERRAVYHEPDGIRHLSEDMGGIRRHRRHPTTPQNGVEPGLIHRVDSHTHIIGQVLPGGRKIQVSTEKREREVHFISPLYSLVNIHLLSFCSHWKILCAS